MLTPVAVRQRGRVGRLWRSHRREVLTVAVLAGIATIAVAG